MIIALSTSNEVVSIDGVEIANDFVAFYKSLLGIRVDTTRLNMDIVNDGPKVLENQWSVLVADIYLVKFRIITFDIDNEKAPGSDGFGSFFFKSAWPIVSYDIFAAVQGFFRSGKLLKQCPRCHCVDS